MSGRFAIRFDRPPLAEEPGAYRLRLAELAQILRGLPWMLAGGLAVPITIGEFYRQHYDVDIAFPLEEFPRIEAAMRRAGYVLTTYFPFSLFGAHRGALHLEVTCTGLLPRWRTRKLKFRDVSGRRVPPHLLAVVEALPYRISGDQLLTCDGRHRVTIDRPLVGHEWDTGNGRVPVLDLDYVRRLKAGKGALKDYLDLAMIRDAPRVARARRASG